MHIYGENEYLIENNVILHDAFYKSLILMYQPIIGADALSLYLSFNHLNIHTNYSNLVNYTGLSIDDIERAIIMLEKYRLISTFKHNDENRFIHVLNSPLYPNEFLAHYVYGLELRKIIGTHQYNVLVMDFKENLVLKNNFSNITERKIFNNNSFSEEDLKEVLSLNKDEVIINDQFNFDLFLSDASELKFPSKLRTKENLNLIAELALFYGISELRMATLVYRSIDYAKMEFVSQKLIERVQREQSDVKHSLNKYDLPNTVFLQDLQNGAAVSQYNKQLLEELAFDMKLNRDVINRLIEYIMETQNNRLTKNYVLQVASTWKAFNVRTLEEANDVIKQLELSQFNNSPNQNTKELIKRNSEQREKEYTKEEEEEIRNRIRKLGEKYGTSDN